MALKESNYDLSNFSKINDIAMKDNYLKERCAYHCNYFLIKKTKK